MLETALSDNSRRIDLYVPPKDDDNKGQAGFLAHDGWDKVKVSATTIDSLMDSE